MLFVPRNMIVTYEMAKATEMGKIIIEADEMVQYANKHSGDIDELYQIKESLFAIYLIQLKN